MSVLYYPDKANVVTDALSRVSLGSMAHVADGKREFVKDVHWLTHFRVRVSGSYQGGIHVQNGSNHCW